MVDGEEIVVSVLVVRTISLPNNKELVIYKFYCEV